MSFTIVTDSSSNLTDQQIQEYGVSIRSLSFFVSGREYQSYVKGQHNDLKKFYDMMRQKETITTSLIRLSECRDLFETILKQGQDLLFIGFSSALSGTYQAAETVAGELREEYPDRKIYTVDTLGASLGEGLLVHHAVQHQKAGESIQEVYQWVLENRLHLAHWFTVDDLFFLKRGGRVSATTALVGTLLGIKPVMHMDNEGRLIPVGKVRGRRTSLDALFDRMKETAIHPEQQTVFISHGDCIEDAEYLASRIRKELHVKEILIHYVDPVIGAHSGPGTVALFFLASHR